MRIVAFLLIVLTAQPISRDYPTSIKEARTCFETGRHESCDSLLAELRDIKLKRLQRRKVCTLWLDNTYHTGRHEAFLEALDSKYVKRNLDRSDYEYWKNVACVPPMEVTWPDKPEPLPLRTIGPEGHSLYGVDVSLNGKRLTGMIDNCCCHYCSISNGLAEELGVQPIGKTVSINGNKRGKAYIGVVDSLSFGSLVVRNVLVDVSDNLAAIQATHPLDIIIGGNVLRRVGDMVIDNGEGSILFTKETLDLPRNVTWAYEDHDYYVEGSLDGRAVTMLFDMGNTNTRLGRKYYDRFPSDSLYTEGTVKTVMADRSWTSKVYVINDARLSFCDADCKPLDINIMLEGRSSRRGDGSIGVDALLQFRRVIFNAGKLYLQLIP